MQTGLPIFDSSTVGASDKVHRTPAGAGAKAKDAAPDQLAGFMEIMSALLALPQEQWRQSLAGIDAISADGGSVAPHCLAGNPEKNPPSAALLKFIMNMKGAVLQELQSAKADGRSHPLLDMAEALMEDPQLAEADSMASGQAQLSEAIDPAKAFKLPESGAQDGAPVDLKNAEKNGLFGGGDILTEKGGNAPAIEAAIDGENIVPAAGEENTSKTSRDPNRAKDFLFKTSDTPTEDALNPATEKAKPQPAAGMSGMPLEERLSVDVERGIDKAHQNLAGDTLNQQGGGAQPEADGANLVEHLVQKADPPPAGGHQGLLWRTESGQVAKGMRVAGGEEAMPREKAEPSDVIRQIVQRMSLHTNGTQSKMVIRLKPEFLGNVHMQVLTENHQVTVRMMADSALVKDIVEQNLPHLQAELQHHGLEIQKFDVFVANDDHGSRNGKEQAGFRDAMNRKQSRSGGERPRHRRNKISLDSGNGEKNVQKDPGEINYFA
jgi:flagellar hook-length control protein FliK